MPSRTNRRHARVPCSAHLIMRCQTMGASHLCPANLPSSEARFSTLTLRSRLSLDCMKVSDKWARGTTRTAVQ